MGKRLVSPCSDICTDSLKQIVRQRLQQGMKEPDFWRLLLAHLVTVQREKRGLHAGKEWGVSVGPQS